MGVERQNKKDTVRFHTVVPSSTEYYCKNKSIKISLSKQEFYVFKKIVQKLIHTIFFIIFGFFDPRHDPFTI